MTTPLAPRSTLRNVEPRIRYARTSDGVSIAYWEMGEGEPLVLLPGYPLSHIQLELQVPEWRAFYEQLARNRRIVRFDGRGMGLSQRDVNDITFESCVADLDAVVQAVGGRADLFGIAYAGAVSIRYARTHPERVHRLLIWCSAPRMEPPPPELQWQLPLMRAQWDQYTNVFVATVHGWTHMDGGDLGVRVLREGITPAVSEKLYRLFSDYDVSGELAEVRAPTLVMHREGVSIANYHGSMQLASHIPGAALVNFEGRSIAPFLGETAPVYRAIDGFLGDSRPAARERPDQALRIILFTDVQNHTPMVRRLGDEAAREVLREHERITRAALRIHGGEEVKSMGDGFMAWFPSASQALECAVDLQRAFDDYNRVGGEELLVRVGINAGEPIEDEDDLYGTAVVTASRIAGQARGGEVLVSNVVRELVAGKGFLFADRGETVLRGFEDPVRVFEVRWHVSPGDDDD